MPGEAMLLLKALPVIAACGIFLRIVGKETRRREKYLELRLHEEEEEMRCKLEPQARETPLEPLVVASIDEPSDDATSTAAA